MHFSFVELGFLGLQATLATVLDGFIKLPKALIDIFKNWNEVKMMMKIPIYQHANSIITTLKAVEDLAGIVQDETGGLVIPD